MPTRQWRTAIWCKVGHGVIPSFWGQRCWHRRILDTGPPGNNMYPIRAAVLPAWLKTACVWSVSRHCFLPTIGREYRSVFRSYSRSGSPGPTHHAMATTAA